MVAHESVLQVHKFVFHSDVLLQTSAGREELFAKLRKVKLLFDTSLVMLTSNKPRSRAKHLLC